MMQQLPKERVECNKLRVATGKKEQNKKPMYPVNKYVTNVTDKTQRHAVFLPLLEVTIQST